MRPILPFAVASLVLAAPLSAQLVQCAAETHLARKGTYTNGTTSSADSGVWEWEIGSGMTYSNIQGISADGGFYATLSTGDPDFALGAFGTVNLLVGRYGAAPTQRPYAQDVDLLLDACAFDPGAYALAPDPAPESLAYCQLAMQYYARVVGEFPDPVANVDRHISPRGSLAGWDVAAHIRAAWRAGFEVYARGMVDRILERRPDWEHVPLGTYDYTDSSWGALVRVILEMHAAGDLGEAPYAEGLAIAGGLIASQAPDGSWGGGDFQATAYVVLGLRADPWTSALPWRQAIVKAVDFLEASATAAPTCGWSYPPEYGEMNSEVISALAMVSTLPFMDDFEAGDISAWSGEVPEEPRRDRPEGPLPSRRPAAQPVP